MVFDPSKTTKSSGLSDPKDVATAPMLAAAAVHIEPLKSLHERSGFVDWNSITWTYAGPVISCISAFYRSEEKKGHIIFKGLNESCNKNGILSFQDFQKVTECLTVSDFYIKYLNVSSVYHRLFNLMSTSGGLIGRLKDDYAEICKQILDEEYKMIEDEREANAAKKVAAKANLKTGIMARAEAKMTERSVSGDFDKMSQNITFETVVSEDDEVDVSGISKLNSVETRGSVSGCIYDRNNHLHKCVTFDTDLTKEEEEDVSDLPNFGFIQGEVSVAKTNISIDHVENFILKESISDREEGTAADIFEYEKEEGVSDNIFEYDDSKNLDDYYSRNESDTNGYDNEVDLDKDREDNDGDYSNDEGNNDFGDGSKIENDGVNYDFSENEGENQNYFEPNDYDNYYESQGEDENYFDNGNDSYEEDYDDYYESQGEDENYRGSSCHTDRVNSHVNSHATSHLFSGGVNVITCEILKSQKHGAYVSSVL